MAETYQITCINKSDRLNPHERIRRVGGTSDGGWTLTEDQAIEGIESGKWQFYVSAGGASVWVIVATHLGRKYLKTTKDGLQPDNFLSLPECP
jgi:hypothetical protein